jgi:hypothetical protein
MRAVLLFLVVSAGLAAERLALRGAPVFDPDRGRFLPPRTVVISEGRIESVLDPGAKLPKGTRSLDLKGAYLIPGLIDAHVHLVHQPDFAHMTPEELLPVYLAWGVTSIRDTGDEIVAEKLAWRWAETHPESAPRVFLCSPLLDGDPPHHADIGRAITDPDKVPDLIADMKAWGVTTLKIYVKTERPVGRRIVEEGRRSGLVVAGHLGKYAAQDAVSDGIDVLEHIWSVFDYSFPEGPRPARHQIDLDNPTARALREQIAARRTMVDPTLSVFRNMILLHDLPEVRASPDNARIPRRLRDHWERYRARVNLPEQTRPARAEEFRKYQELTGLLYRAGVPLLAGTDSPEPYVPPGASLHQELERLVESGLTPAAALAAATLQNARALRQESNLGSVAAGKLADLVVLDANPVDDIRNTRKIRWVVRGGRMLKPEVVLQALAVE